MLSRADAIIRADRHITTRQLALHLSLSTGGVCSSIATFGYSKVCSKWAPRSLTADHKIQRKTISSELLERFEQETKRQSMEWHHPQSPRKKKFKTAPSAGKVVVTVFWDCGGVILVDVMPRSATINSEAYINTLNKLKKRFR
jgi:hypothetical protein